MKWIHLSVFLLVVLAASAFALPVEIKQVELDGDELDATADNGVRAIDRDNAFEVRVEIEATADVEDAQVEVYLRGYDHDDLIQDVSDVFDMTEGRTYVKKFDLTFPYRVDKDQYKLRVRVEDRDGDSTEETYELAIEAERHDMRIQDVVFSPSDSVMAGRSLLTTVRLRNVGMEDPEEGVKVAISVPGLGVSAADYIDEVDEDDSVTSEELFLRIPSCAKAGTYDAIISVEYDDGDETETVTEEIKVSEDPACVKETAPQQPKTIITVGPSTQDVVKGEGGVIYPLTISNAGSEAKTYVVSLDGYSDWATVTLSPANIVVLQPGEAKAIYVYVTATEKAQPGEHTFSLRVSSGSETLKEFLLKSNVVAGEEPKDNLSVVKNALWIMFGVLIVILVIFGLIILFTRRRSSERQEEREESKDENYY
jgi:hypothetical protein